MDLLVAHPWNSTGVPVVYTSATLALAVLETLVHVDTEDLPTERVSVELDVPDDGGLTVVALKDVPPDWQSYTESLACRAIGDAWAARGDTLLLRVPSVVVPSEWNYLLNPRHASAGQVWIRGVHPFPFDERLKKLPVI